MNQYNKASTLYINDDALRTINEIYASNISEIFQNHNIITKQKYQNLNAEKTSIAKIPYLLHHIWLTHPDSPKEMRPQDIENTIRTKMLFDQLEVTWKHIVWTNAKELIPNSITSLIELGISVNSIYDYKDNIELLNLIDNLILKQQWGMASDTLRYSIVKHFGGVYSDLNFIFNRDTTEEAHRYNFFTTSDKDYYIGNYFFGASPEHPILESILYLVERNLTNPPKYIQSIDDPKLLTITSTANPIYLSYYKEANKAGNIDIIYPRINKFSVNLFPQEENKNQQCSNENAYYNLVDYINSNEICGLDEYNIGYDSLDGLTWL